MILASTFDDLEIVDARDPHGHQTSAVEFPVFVAIAAEPLAVVVVPLVGEANGNAVFVECPDFLDQPVVLFALPFARQKGFDRRAARDELGTIAPTTLFRVGQGDTRW